MAVTFNVIGSLADFGDDNRGGVTLTAKADPAVKIGPVSIHSNNPYDGEPATTEPDGTFTLTLVSIVGLWFTIDAPHQGAINPVRLAAYIPDEDDPSTGEVFAQDYTINLRDVMDEDPTPGYAPIAVYPNGGGGGVTDHDELDGRSDPDQHTIGAITGLQAALDDKATDADLAGHAADTTGVHGITDTAALVVTTDPRLTDARPPLAHTSASVTDFTEAAQDAIAALLAGASGVSLSYDDVANTLTITGGGSGGLDAEAVRDAIGVALVGSGLITVTVNDALDTITISTTATANDTNVALRDRSTHTGTQALGTITGTGDAAAKSTGTTAGTVAAGDDSRIGKINGTVAVSGTPTAGQVPVASSGTAAAWAAPSDSWTYAVATADTANTTTTAANAAGLSIPVLADGLWEFRAFVIASATATTIGAQIGLANNATGATVTTFGQGTSGAAASVTAWPGTAQLPMTVVSINAPTTSSSFVGAVIEGTVRAASMTGTVDVTVKTEQATNSVSVKADSFIRYRRIAA